ncbi:hypothetical protein [Phenylobacterium sp. SCN 70-31]|uniref:hypothetical protein n=1 Tax=Phenylobacterium sp. SCN 70-31 TaxID=1660129 RepID=UPI0025E13B75|nr:hypothetical protein [Phenylobacterium sp. SCN 70-31]
MQTTTRPEAPSGLVQALGQLEGLGGLLACACPDRWDSLARPQAAQLAALTHAIHAELRAELADHFDLPSPH